MNPLSSIPDKTRGTMDSQQYLLFHGFLGRECVFALMARDEMERSLKNHFRRGMTPEKSIAETDAFWYSVDAFLMSTGNISKVFWPPLQGKPKEEAERNRKRGEGLRRILDIQEDSPFRDRKLRNLFEHFDQELDKWLLQGDKRPVVVVEAIMPSFQIGITESIFPAKIFRSFDRDSWTLYCMGDTLPFREVVKAVQTLQESLRNHLPT
jgi:hypothetical protein